MASDFAFENHVAKKGDPPEQPGQGVSLDHAVDTNPVAIVNCFSVYTSRFQALLDFNQFHMPTSYAYV